MSDLTAKAQKREKQMQTIELTIKKSTIKELDQICKWLNVSRDTFLQNAIRRHLIKFKGE